MKALLKNIFSFLFLIWGSLLLNIITWFYVLLKIKPTSEVLPLHYNIFYGTDYTGRGYYLYLIPLIGLCLWAINYFFWRYAKFRDPFAAQLIIVVGFVVQIFVLIAVVFLKSIIVI